jgi:hypothetical protein
VLRWAAAGSASLAARILPAFENGLWDLAFAGTHALLAQARTIQLIGADAHIRDVASCGSVDDVIAGFETGFVNAKLDEGESAEEDRLLRRYGVPWVWIGSPHRRAGHDPGLGVRDADFAEMFDRLSVRLVTALMFVASGLGEQEPGSESVRLFVLARTLSNTFDNVCHIESTRQLTIDHDIDYLDEPEEDF